MLVDAAGGEVDAINTDGSAAVAVELRLPAQHQGVQQLPAAGGSNGLANGCDSSSSSGSNTDYALHERIERNTAGTFYKVCILLGLYWVMTVSTIVTQLVGPIGERSLLILDLATYRC